MGFRIPHFQHFPPFASIIFLSFLIFQHPPCPPAGALPGAQPSGRAGNTGNKPPLGAWFAPLFPCRPGSARGCKGRSPLHEITLGSPFPGGEGGRGMGAGKKIKAGGSRRQRRHTPAGHLNGRNCTCRKRSNTGEGGGGMGAKSKLKSGAAGNPKGKPPLWIPEWHGQPATSRAPPRLAPQRQAEPATARHISPPQ